MKILTKQIIFFFGLIALIFFAFNISVGQTYACDRFTTCNGYQLSQMCAFFTATVNVTNPPNGKNIYVGCNGDNGDGYVKNMQVINGACKGQYCDGHYGGSAGQNWCQGEIQQVTNGGTVNLTHCSCQGKVNGACLQVLLSPNTPTMTNACTLNANPTIDTTGSLPENNNCTVSPLACESNNTTTTTTINITCPAPIPTATPVPTATPTPIPTATPVPTATPTPIPTATPVPTATPTPIPTATPVPNSTTLSLTIGLDSIGHTGDRVNADWTPKPNALCANQTPIDPTRHITVSLFGANEVPKTFTGDVRYNSTTGKFATTTPIDLGTIAAGTYEIQVVTDAHLVRTLDTAKVIIVGQDNAVDGTQYAQGLVAGDINMDNQLSILDYNILMSCLHDPDINDFDKTTCNGNRDFIKRSDLEDNGVVDKFDYNLFLREFSVVQSGDNPPNITQTNTSSVDVSVVSTVETATPSAATTIEPTVIVTPTVTIVPTETITPSVTVVPTVTTTPTVTVTPSTTPTVTVVPTETITPSVTVTP
jgi:hypothetical protein